MASPQWKNYQAPVQDPAILAFQRSPNMANFTVSASPPATVIPAPTVPVGSTVNNSIRETGVIEKMLHSYGFIQCYDREARLFFHFSEYAGNTETMKVGDPVEFQMSFDRRTGKPIAVSVIKLEQGSVSFELLSDNRVTGNVVAEAKSVVKGKPPASNGNAGSNQDGLGRVSYEQSGEFFFIPFAQEDVEGNSSLHVGDEVTFYIATDKRNGSHRARKIKLVQPAKQEAFDGVVCSMKDNYGFIERSDMVKEIFFHYSEFQGNVSELVLGDDVEFNIQTRNGKEVAVNIRSLPEGTVIFEDIAVEPRRGKILKTLKSAHGRHQSDPLAGRIVYETVKGSIEIPFGDKDQKGDYTLQPNDLVQFNIATDRRDKLQRATHISLVEDTFKVNTEKRESGLIATLKDGFGFIRCADREARMFFHFSEMMETEREPKVQDDVEFTIIQDPTAPSRLIAIRIKYLPKGTVSFETVLTDRYTGTIEKEPASYKQSTKGKEPDPGIIMYDVNGTKQTIPFYAKASQGQPPKYGDKVEFQICESRKNNTKTASNVRVMTRTSVGKQYGFIATLKDSFGFIEMADHEKEVFFHFSAVEGDTGELDLGDEVEFTFSRKTAKVSAENICKVPKGTVAPEEVLPGTYDGKIVRCMRIINPEQDEYPGLVQIGTEDDETEVYPYGITSLYDKKDFLQKGDAVKFSLTVTRDSGKKRATNIAAIRKYVRAKVDSLKGLYGFLTYEATEGKKLFFHMTEVHDGAELQPGDEVEFVVVLNQRTGKYSACSLRKITEHRRPERLISRLKSVGEDCGPRMTAIRQPRGPDGTKGFNQERTPWKPPV